VCGADATWARPDWFIGGTPPLMRGGQGGRDYQYSTPGNTPRVRGSVCGADVEARTRRQESYGTPPRVRGGRPLGRHRRRQRRDTPACAGRTSWRAPSGTGPAGHPRVCGADVVKASHSLRDDGTPPRVRGGRCRAFLDVADQRDTPACAGGHERAQRGLGAQRDTPACAGRTLRDLRVCQALARRLPSDYWNASWGGPG
jgi:hypothetical protein